MGHSAIALMITISSRGGAETLSLDNPSDEPLNSQLELRFSSGCHFTLVDD